MNHIINIMLRNIVLIFILFTFLSVAPYNLDDYTFMTEHFPPYNYLEDGELKGISVDIMVEIFKKLGISKTKEDIIIQPWARSYNYIENNKNVSLFAMKKSDSRLNKFKWVGPFIANYSVLIGKKSRNIVINSVGDLKRYKVGVIRGEVGEDFLKEKNITPLSIVSVAYTDQLIKMLNSDRIDLWITGILASKWIINENNLKEEDFVALYQLDNSMGAYFAFNIDTPDEVISLFQQAFDEIVEEGVYDLILNKYLN